ncbi:MAG: hypothetical protein ACE5KM_18980 [Planctomycetaceae bacterium]
MTFIIPVLLPAGVNPQIWESVDDHHKHNPKTRQVKTKMLHPPTYPTNRL